MASDKVYIFRGNFIHSTAECVVNYINNHVLGIQNGKIIFFEHLQSFDERKTKFDHVAAEIYTMNDGEFLIPGFIDAHLHAPQFVNIGCALDEPLIEWLNKYTFPTESKFANLQWARNVYELVVKRVLANGTTTASYFATIHKDATSILCDILEKEGQRGFVGKVNMDSMCPDYYIEDTNKSIEETENFIQDVFSRNNNLITPVISPRFALSCSEELMKALADISNKYNLPIQSHVSENPCEIASVLESFKTCECYCKVYEKNGLLTKRTYLAHGVHLTEDDLRILKETETGIVHCPNSNISLCSGLCDVRRLLNEGVKVGLGTDVSGGFSASMLDAIRNAVQTSKIVSLDKANYKILSHEEAFCLATLGNSRVLGIQDKVGNFEVGKEFDAVLVDTTLPGLCFDTTEKDDLKHSFQRFIYTGDDRNLKEIYVAGKMVSGTTKKH